MGKRVFPQRAFLRAHIRQEGRNLVWVKPMSNRAKPGGIAGSRSSDGYIWIGFNGKRFSGHQIAWILAHNTAPPSLIDHINGDRADNRPENLRPATLSQNAANSVTHRDCKSGRKGVHRHSDGRWRAQITVNRKRIHLGCFDDKEEAATAYARAARLHFHEYWSAG